MKKVFLASLAFALVATLGAIRTFAQAAASTAPEDKTAPSYDMKAQALLDLDQVNKKVISLAEALPQDKYNWRPAPDARSVVTDSGDDRSRLRRDLSGARTATAAVEKELKEL